MALLLVSALVLVWSIPRAHAEPHTRVALDVRNSVVTKPSVLAGALREAAAIWAPYGIAIETVTRKGSAPDLARTWVVPVTLESARARGQLHPGSTPLGWTGFERSGQPMMRISIFYDAIALAASGGLLFGRREVHSSMLLEERLLARVLGRTLAHEVGHVILRSADHSAGGLMRASQSVVELQHPSKAGFALEPADIARLGRVLPGAAAVTGTRH